MPKNIPDLGRRRMLTKLGLAAGAVYAAPALLQLSQARASDGGSNGRRGRVGGSNGGSGRGRGRGSNGGS